MKEVQSAADEGMIELNADSLYTIIKKGCLKNPSGNDS